MLVHVRRFQASSSQCENTAALLRKLGSSSERRTINIHTFSKVFSVFMAALSLLIMIVFTVQTAVVTPLALYTAAFLACCVLIYMAIFIVQSTLSCSSPPVELTMDPIEVVRNNMPS